MLKKTLRWFQDEAVAKALPHPGFMLFMEQRTGKTLTSLALVDKRKPRVLFIVTIKKGVPVWEKEIKESLKIDWDCQVVITYFQQLHKNRAKWRKYFRENGPDGIFIICDECHKIKRRGSQPARTVRYLGQHAQWRLGLTGTPLQPSYRTKRRGRVINVTEGLEDAWSQFDFIDPSIFGTQEEFEKTYLRMGGFRGFQVVGYRNKKRFYRLFHAFSYRKLLREVQDKKTIIKRVKVRFRLGPKSRKVYESMDRKMYAEVNGTRVTIPALVARVQKLQQISGGFLIDKENDQVHILSDGQKIAELHKLLKKIFSQDHGEKVVICAKFIPEIEMIQHLLSRMGLSHQVIAGGSEYSGGFKVRVTVIQIQSGIAIDLADANSFIFYSMSQDYIDYEQARFRILSFSKRQATFYYLLARDSMDELVYESQTRKKNLSTLVLEHYRRKYEQSDRIGSRRSVHRRLAHSRGR
jgi:SNF2 family DNA or RNA helicase